MRRLQCDDEGAATAEFAVVLPVIVMLAALMLYLGRASVVSVGCQDAAANAARALMVQGSGSGSQAMAQAAAGDGARIEVRPAGIGFEVIAHCAVVADNGDGACTWHMAGEAMKEVAKWVCEGVRPGEG